MINKIKQKRIAVIVATVFFAAFVLLCLAFNQTLLFHGHEDGIAHNDCVICQIISNDDQTQTATTNSFTYESAILFLPVFILLCSIVLLHKKTSPIQEKVKLTL